LQREIYFFAFDLDFVWGAQVLCELGVNIKNKNCLTHALKNHELILATEYTEYTVAVLAAYVGPALDCLTRRVALPISEGVDDFFAVHETMQLLDVAGRCRLWHVQQSEM